LFADTLADRCEWVWSDLEDNIFLTGPNFAAPDAYLFTVTRWAKYVKVEIAGLKSLQAFTKRVIDRQTFRKVLQCAISFMLQST
jgi:glutathione S-transferase